MRYLRRQLEKTILSAKKTFPAVLVTGPRQSGKTTMLKTLLADTAGFISLEEPDRRLWALEDPRDFLSANKTPLIIDEIQYAPGLLPYIKQRIDDNRKPGQWFLTGSQQFTMMKNITESLAGRVAILNLLPLSLSEIKGRLHKTREAWLSAITSNPAGKGDLGHAIIRGSYPEPALNGKVNRKLWYDSYVQTYLERDLKSIYDIGNLSTFMKFLTLLAARTGQIMNYSTYAGELGISVPTVKKWLSILEASFIVFVLPPYYTNTAKRLIKSPKVYFTDTGLPSYLTGTYDPSSVLKGPMGGPLFENLIVSEFVKNYLHHGDRPDLFFLNHKNAWEIDLLAEREQRFVPIEIKLSATITPNHLKNFGKARAIVENMSQENCLICTQSGNTFMMNTRIAHWSAL